MTHLTEKDKAWKKRTVGRKVYVNARVAPGKRGTD
jgi:hypothetical protein